MDDLAEQLALRDQFRRKLAARETPSERMQALARLQLATWEALRRSPQGWDRFIRRNFKARAIRVEGGTDVT